MIYKIHQKLLEFQEAVENGEIPEEAINDTFDMLQADFNNAADNIACLVKNLKSEVDAISLEEKHLKERKTVKVNLIERYKELLLKAMLDAGVKKIETPRNRISLAKSQPSVTIQSGAIDGLIMNNPDMVTVSYTPSKTKIKEALLAGETIEGCTLINDKMGVRIK